MEPSSILTPKIELVQCILDTANRSRMQFLSVLTPRPKKSQNIDDMVNTKKRKIQECEYINTSSEYIQSPFPPKPISKDLRDNIISDFALDTCQNTIEETGCAVCAELTPLNKSVPLSDVLHELNFLKDYCHVTRKERHNDADPITYLDDIVIDRLCTVVCSACLINIKNKRVPKNALANGLWIGSVPKELEDLTWVEKRLIARVRVNTYIVQVSSGRYKIKGNVVAYAHPTPKIYQTLPPPREDLDETLAVVFVGPSKSKDEELKRTPLLVRRNKVAIALRWLKLNHVDYSDISISDENLRQYPECDVPSIYIYKYKETNVGPENTSVNEVEEEEGVSEGECPFIVHGLLGSRIINQGWTSLSALALKHIREGTKILAIGHNESPESIFNNPALYPQIFPWLFPYGLGGIQNEHIRVNISAKNQKAHHLMYYDKRFQFDKLFPIVAFNHEQIQSSSTGGYLLTKKSCFKRVTNNILDIDLSVLDSIINRMKEGIRIIPSSVEEQKCFKVLRDLDHVTKDVDGSLSSKKDQRTELWSMLARHGAPSWFITFAPADIHHPLSLYYAGKELKYKLNKLTSDEKYNLVAQNPMSGARFFNVLVNAFLKHVLGVGTDHDGLYGKTKAYYGAVEQQGRLTLHLHLLLWIENALLPQRIRDRIMSNDGDFQNSLIDYLKSCHTGDYLNATHIEVKNYADDMSADPHHMSTLENTAIPPPSKPCDENHYQNWERNMEDTINDILFRTNYHTCKRSVCMNNKYHSCRARFPREYVKTIMIDPTTGAICLEKHEQWLNTFTPLITYLLRCNTDTTSLLSGTAIKAAIAYITDYISKSSLKSHVIFESLKTVYERSTEILESQTDRTEKGRKILTRLANSLIGKHEIGSPMASMYLLNHPDHYTNQTFTNFYWKSYVDEALRSGHDDQYALKEYIADESIMLSSRPNLIIAVSSVFDYIYRPHMFDEISLYDWIKKMEKVKVRGKQSDIIDSEETDQSDNESVTSHDVIINNKRSADAAL